MKKLIEEYRNRIRICNTEIMGITNKIRSIRKNGADSYFYTVDELANERKVSAARRQCYVQFIVDIEPK